MERGKYSWEWTVLSERIPRRSGKTQKYTVRRRIQLRIMGGVDVGWKEMVCTFEMKQGKTAARDLVFPYHSRSRIQWANERSIFGPPFILSSYIKFKIALSPMTSSGRFKHTRMITWSAGKHRLRYSVLRCGVWVYQTRPALVLLDPVHRNQLSHMPIFS